MTSQTVTLRIVGDNGQLVGTIRASKSELKGLGTDAASAGNTGARGLDKLGDAADRTQRKAGVLSGTLRELKGLLAGYVGVQSVRELARAADTYSDIVGKLAQVTTGERDLAVAKAATFAIAQKTYQQLDATVTLYSRSAQALAQYNVSQAKVAELTETINQGLLVSRATTAESASAVLQLSQALGAGALRGEEFNAVNEAAPRLMQALAESLGVPRGKLKELAEEGELTVDKLLKAWTGSNAKKIATEASEVPLTIERAWQQVKNRLVQFVGEGDQLAGTSRAIAAAIGGTADVLLDDLVPSLVRAASEFGAFVTDGHDAEEIGEALRTVVSGLGDAAEGAASLFEGFRVVLQGISNDAFNADHSLADLLRTIGQGGTVLGSVGDMLGGAAKQGWGILSGDASLKAAGTFQIREAERRGNRALYNRADFSNVVGTPPPDFSNVRGTPVPDREPTFPRPESANGDAARRKREAEEERRDAERRRESIARYREEIERLEAQLQGPLRVAEVEHQQRVAELQAALDAHNIAQDDFTRGKALAERQLSATRAELELEADVVGRVLRDYDEQIRLSGLHGRARRVEEQVIRAVADAEAEAVRQGREWIRLSPERIEQMRREFDMREQVLEINEHQARAAEEFAGTWTQAVDAVSAAFGDWMARGFKDFDGFLDSMKGIFQRWLADIISMFARAQLARVASGWLAALGGTSTGTNWQSLALQGVSQYLGGGSGGFSSAGGAGNYLSMIGSLFGGGGGAAAATGAWGAGLGSAAALSGASTTSAFGAFGASSPYWVGGTAAGASGAGGAGAGSAGAAGAGGAAAAAWVLAILAGMYMNAQWYKQGWQVNGQRNDIIKASGYNLDNMAVLGADRLLQSLGVNGKWAAILSGSAGIAKAWGHQKPKVSATGFMGSIGFGGFDGQAYADIKAKGGWFRSDKKWTETSAISAGIDRAFDSIAISIRGRAQGIAEQLGTDITQALGAFKLDLGKIKLDKDPEKAKQQIQDKIAEVTEQMINAAVGALGFGHLLDDGFAAADIMTALSASIELVTGSAKDLGRALTDFERGNITKAVEYFEGMALKNGTELAAEVERVLGLLNSYAGVMAGVNQQLRTAGLNDFQKAQLDIELQYRSQVKQLNEMAKALGLSGARAEDLAQLEQLRALNMANLQAQMEAQRNSFLSDLGLSDLSPLRDDQKLAESMQLLRDAVSSGDLSSAQGYAQTALGFGRNLYASGADYNALYGEVTGMLRDMELASTAGLDDATLREIADGIIGLPDNIARALFNLSAGINPVPPPETGGNNPAAPTGDQLDAIENALNRINETIANGNNYAWMGAGGNGGNYYVP